MSRDLNRREFLAASACAASAFLLGRARAGDAKESFKHKLQKALIAEVPHEKVLRAIKDAGFDGVEAGVVSRAEAEKARKIAEKLGLKIHSVIRGWAKFNSDKAGEVEETFATTVAGIEAAVGYGANAILLVPCRIDTKPRPEPWEFNVSFDEKTGHLTAVTKNDAGRYGEYIAAHNHAYDRSAEAIKRLIPIAAKAGVVIGIENVWNNLFVDPRHMANFVDSFESPHVQAYFDIGNHVKYSPPEKWIDILGKRIVRCHVKDFRLAADGRGGKFVDIRQGSVNWPLVRRKLDEIGYKGWMTIEGSRGLPFKEQSRRLDYILAGE